LDRRIFKGVARIRRLQSPTQWEVGVRSTLLRGACFDVGNTA
jgi:hypothetical protein